MRSTARIKGVPSLEGPVHRNHCEDLEAVAVKSTRTIDIDQFVPRDEIGDLYNVRPSFFARPGSGPNKFVTSSRQVVEPPASLGGVANTMGDCLDARLRTPAALRHAWPGTGGDGGCNWQDPAKRLARNDLV